MPMGAPWWVRMTISPLTPGGQELPSSSIRSTSYRGAGLPMEPGTTFIQGKVARVATSSVCPKASRNSTPVRFTHSWAMSGLSGSPATEQCFRLDRS